jgi:hypothetical protein
LCQSFVYIGLFFVFLVTYEKKRKKKKLQRYHLLINSTPQASSRSGLASSFGGVVTTTKDELELALILVKTSAHTFPSRSVCERITSQSLARSF